MIMYVENEAEVQKEVYEEGVGRQRRLSEWENMEEERNSERTNGALSRNR